MYSNTTKKILSQIRLIAFDGEDESQGWINDSMEELAASIVIGDIRRNASSFEDEVKAIKEALGSFSISASLEFAIRVANWVMKNGSVTPPSDVAQKARALVNLFAREKDWTPDLKAEFLESLEELQKIGEELG